MKLWGGRFEKDIEKAAYEFNSSIKVDKRLYKYDILGSIAHVKMLGECNIIPHEDSKAIQNTLLEILDDIEKNKLEIGLEHEDVHTFVETVLISRLGEVGKKLHTGRSRNDQVALDIRMYAKEEIKEIIAILKNLGSVIIKLAEENTDTVMPGFTHLQKAQPVTFAHHLMAYFQMFRRDLERLVDAYKRVNIMPLGAGALAGTTYPLDREKVREYLDFDLVTENSLDSVSDRDFIIELCSSISIIMMHLSRFCEELVIWSTGEFNFIEIDDSYTTGSSIMPQKKNPDMAELIRGKSGRVYGNLMSILTVMKALPLAYNKDMQEDKEGFFDSVDTVKSCLIIFYKMLEGIRVKKDNMLKDCKEGFIDATDAADYLVKKGMPFRKAHEVSGRIVLFCISNNKTIEEVTIDEFKKFSELFENDIYDAVNLNNCVNERKTYGGPSEKMVLKSIENAKEFVLLNHL